MAEPPILLPQGVFAGHARAALGGMAIDDELTRVGPGTPCGEYLRRFWLPVALKTMVGTAPVGLRRLGEDLVLFRDRAGALGLLHAQCCHRNASLVAGIVETHGLRCAYHGWVFDIDGTILEMPTEPADSPIRGRLSQGAYPVLEHKGVIFAYFGPIAAMPDFPRHDTIEAGGEELAPVQDAAAVNWLQVVEAAIDPFHAAFARARAAGEAFVPQAAWVPVVGYHERAGGNGGFHIAARRLGGHVWLRVEDQLPPCFVQSGPARAPEAASLHFRRPVAARWVVPVDDGATVAIGWRHREAGEPAAEAPWLGQGRVNVHGREQLGDGDAGVAMFRRRLRRAVRRLAAGEAPLQPSALVTIPIPTYGCDTVLAAPARGEEDRQFMAGLGHRVADMLRASDGETGETRLAAIRRGLRQLEAGLS